MSQSVFQGTLVDSETGEPIAFANVFFKNNQYIGTLSRQDGAFRISHPKKKYQDTIIISSIAYQNISLATTEFSKTSKQILLKPEMHNLDEVIIVPDNLLVELLTNVIDNIPKNYPSQRHRLHGFYQEYGKSYDDYTSYLDGLMTLEYEDYDKNIPIIYDTELEDRRPDFHENIYLHQLRRSEDFSNLTAYLKHGLLSTNISFISVNPLYQKSFSLFRRAITQQEWKESLENDVRNRYIKLVNLGYEISGQDTLQRVGVLQIPYQNKERYLQESEWVINLSDFGVVSIRVVENKPDSHIKEDNRISPWEFYEEIQFRKIEDTYYPTLFIYNFGFSYIHGSQHHFRSRKYFVETVEQSSSEFQKRRPTKQLSDERNIYNIKLRYRKDFWSQFKTPFQSNSIDQFESDLNRGKLLLDQFKKNRVRKNDRK